jgi:GGDEF domain-containing protein
MPEIDFQPEADAIDFLPEDAPATLNQPRGSLSLSSAELESVTRPQSPAPTPPSSGRLSIGPPHARRSVAEGLETEQEERRAGMPLVLRPANYGLESPRPAGITPVPRPTSRVSVPVAPTIDTSQPANAPFTPEEMGERTRQKQADEAATRSIPQNYQTVLETGRRAGTIAGENAAAWATPSPKPGGYGLITDQNRGEFETAHPAVAGVSRAAGGFAGQMTADPVTYLFAGSSELASPILDRIISTGFRLGLGVGAVRAARDLQKNWNSYTPAQRYEVATEAGLSGALAVGAKQIREHLGSPYEALPKEPTARAESLFRNLVYKAGGTVPENPTLQEAAAVFRAAMNNLHPDVNPATAEDATNLSAAWSTLKTSGRFGLAPPTPKPTRLELAEYLDRAGHNPDVAGALYESDHAAKIAPPVEAVQPERIVEHPRTQESAAAISARRAPDVATSAIAKEPTIDFVPEPSTSAAKPNAVTQPERRQNPVERQRVSEMSADQMRQELLRSRVVDLPNRRAFDEAGKSPAVAMSDADGLKALNDKFGYEAGNELLRAKAEALKQAGLDSYHAQGDEFLHRGASPEELSSKLEQAREILRNRVIQVTTPDGKTESFKGADFSYGHGSNLTEAESGLKANKSEREARGERARGELRNIRRVTPEGVAAGNETASAPSAAEVSRQKLGLPPSPGGVGEMGIPDLKVAPSKFQYKLSTDAQGTSTLLKNTRVWNPDLAGIVSVWRDPNDGITYVVNGHHRLELAKRTGQGNVTVRHIIAKDATTARAIGAMQNIAEGRGTAIDAAKFFRDTGTTPEHLEAKGVSLGEATARDGLALSRLDTPIFQRAVSGDLRVGRAVAIGQSTGDPAEQKAILGLVERKERTGYKVSDDTLAELVRLVKDSEQRTETTADLFGTQEINRSLALEKAEISAYIKQQLSRDKRLFGFVAKETRAQELARAGNKINVEESGRISTEAAQAEEVYNKLSERGGPIASILDESARRLADGENAATVKADAYQRVRAEVSQTLSGAAGRSAKRFEGASESHKTSESGTRQQETPVKPTLPGMESVPAERAAADAEEQGRRLSEKIIEPPQSIEARAGEIEQRSPLFRDTEANPQREMFSSESGTFTPAALNPARLKKLYSDFISRVINENLDLGDKYRRVAEHDPEIAKFLHDKDNAPRYYRDKAQSNVDQVTRNLNESQIRLTAMMADSDAREFLQENHPDQYDEARNDPAVMAGVQRFQKYQQELAALRVALGWHVRRDLSTFEDEDGNWQVLDRNGKPVLAMGGKLGRPEIFKSQREAQDYVEQHGKILDHLKRTYPEHLREPLMGRTDAGPNVTGYSGQGIRPPKPDKKQRLASAEYFWDHGAKDFSGYLQSYAQARHATLNKAVFDAITDEGTQWKAGTAQPKQIAYRGKTYYSPDVAASMRSGGMKNVPEFKAYDPSRDDKLLIKSFEDGWGTLSSGRPGISVHDRWLAPKQVVDALDQYDTTRGYQENDSIRRFFQEQIVGLFGPTVHMLNIMRRLAHTVGSGAWDPRVWPYYQKLLFSSELRERMAQGLADDAIDALSKHGTYTNARDVGSLHDYALGNMDPRNWARWTVGTFSKGILFDPKFLGGFGGVDQKARVLAYDFLHEKAGMGEEEAAKNVDDGFGRYNRASWTERMKRWARVLLFPGWDFSSLTWFLRHPIKTAVLPSLVTLGANLALNVAGKNKDQDKYDYGYLHYGDRKFRTSLLTESMALHIAEPLLEAGKAALEGGSAQDIGTAAGEGAIRGGGGLAGALRPDIQVAISVLSNRQYPGGTKEITKPQDKNLPGRVLPNRKLDKLAVFALVKAFPAVNRFLDSSYDNVDWKTGVGSVLGVTNYNSGAEERLRANAAKAMGYSQTLSSLNVTDEAAAERFVADPNKAVYLAFNGDLSQLEKDLKDLDVEISRVKMAGGLTQRARKEALKELEDARTQLLNSADALNDQLSAVKLKTKTH